MPRNPPASRLAPAAASRGSSPTPARPFLKWAGGKWSLAARIAALLPADLERRTYREPFLGGGAMFFWLKAHRPPKRAVLSDALRDLVHTYEVVRDAPEELVHALEALRDTHSHEQYYRVRDDFNHAGRGSAVERAAWLIYLNKTCYNGLFRTNRAGMFNVPVGSFVRPRIVDRARLLAASAALAKAEVRSRTFEHLLDEARAGDVVYLDPPYVPLSKTASFASYALGAFGPDDQSRLADVFRALDERGCLLALSNSDTPEVRKLYRGFAFERIVAARSISSQGSTRLPVFEVLVRNVARWPRAALAGGRARPVE